MGAAPILALLLLVVAGFLAIVGSSIYGLYLGVVSVGRAYKRCRDRT